MEMIKIENSVAQVFVPESPFMLYLNWEITEDNYTRGSAKRLSHEDIPTIKSRLQLIDEVICLCDEETENHIIRTAISNNVFDKISSELGKYNDTIIGSSLRYRLVYSDKSDLYEVTL